MKKLKMVYLPLVFILSLGCKNSSSSPNPGEIRKKDKKLNLNKEENIFFEYKYKYKQVEIILHFNDIIGVAKDVGSKEKAAVAIVNAANPHLDYGSGIANAIRKAVGESAQKDANELGKNNNAGEAIIGSKTGQLSNYGINYIIHQIAIWASGTSLSSNQYDLINKSTYEALKKAQKNKIEKIIFPLVATGVGGVPPIEASNRMLSTIKKYIDENKDNLILKEIHFAVLPKDAYEALVEKAEEIFKDYKKFHFSIKDISNQSINFHINFINSDFDSDLESIDQQIRKGEIRNAFIVPLKIEETSISTFLVETKYGTNQYDFPGGKIDSHNKENEKKYASLTAAIRELYEETCATIDFEQKSSNLDIISYYISKGSKTIFFFIKGNFTKLLMDKNYKNLHNTTLKNADYSYRESRSGKWFEILYKDRDDYKLTSTFIGNYFYSRTTRNSGFERELKTTINKPIIANISWTR